MESRPWREVTQDLRPNEPIIAGVLCGTRGREYMTQQQLSELTGIPKHNISEMEQGKYPIGKENTNKLAAELKTDYRVFL